MRIADALVEFEKLDGETFEKLFSAETAEQVPSQDNIVEQKGYKP